MGRAVTMDDIEKAVSELFNANKCENLQLEFNLELTRKEHDKLRDSQDFSILFTNGKQNDIKILQTHFGTVKINILSDLREIKINIYSYLNNNQPIPIKIQERYDELIRSKK